MKKDIQTAEQISEPRRVVAIVGRPNVGKSALFNRLSGRRLAIVHEESGVTRDRVMTEASWDDQRYELIDTGGLGQLDHARPDDIFDQGIRVQIDAAIEDAAALIFVVDITAGVTPLDEQVARNLRESGREVFIAANKADTEMAEGGMDDFAGLGFGVFPVSALHNRGIEELMDEVAACLPEAQEETVTEPLKVAIVGKPNVGKSSYINRLLNHNRVIVSEIPGTTRDSIEIPFSVGKGPTARHYQLIDTAGMRRKRKVNDAIEKFSIMRAERSIERADVVVLVVDATKGPGSQDKRIASLIADHQKGALILIHKWDLAEVTQRAYGAELKITLPFLNHIPVIFASSKSGYNIRKSIEAIDYVSAQVNTELSTGVLNRTLQDAFNRVQPPMVRSRRLKIYYATQIGTRPVRVKLFVNSPKLITPAYKTYLTKALRSAFGLEGAPVILHFSARRPPRYT